MVILFFFFSFVCFSVEAINLVSAQFCDNHQVTKLLRSLTRDWSQPNVWGTEKGEVTTEHIQSMGQVLSEAK